MRIAMLGHKRIPSREGGIEIVVEELCTRMVEKGHTVCCYNRSGHHVNGKEFDQAISRNYRGIEIKHAFTISKKGLSAVSASFSASMAVALGKYDVVHIHAEGPAAFCWIPKLFGKKVVCTVHGLDHQRAKWGKFASWFIRSGEKNAVKYANEIIVLSRNTQDYFQQNYGRKTCYIPNGVSQPEVLEAKRITEKWGLRKDSYILYLGRLVPEKGIHYLLEAFQEVKTDKKLVIAGGSSDTQVYEEQLKKMSNENIIFTGFQQGQVLEELYSNAYVYVLPSDLEGMPISLLEAMSYGNCCLTSDIAECTEVMEDKGVSFKKGNIGDLREKLQILCDRTQLVNQYKNIAADYVCSKYNWDDVVNKTLAVYRGEISK